MTFLSPFVSVNFHHFLMLQYISYFFLTINMDTKLSSKGQVIIPKQLRDINDWQPGQELTATSVDGGVLLKPKTIFPETTIDDVLGCLNYEGNAKTIEEMNESISIGIKNRWKK